MEPSKSAYAANMFGVEKQSSAEIRCVQDLQRLNAVTIRDCNQMPNLEDLVERYSGRAIYSTLDCHSFYDQFLIHPDDRPLTAVHTPMGLMQMVTMPMGWCNSVAEGQRTAVQIFHGLMPEVVEPVMDDVNVKGPLTEEADSTEIAPGIRKFVADHIADCDRVLAAVEASGVTFKGAKSKFGVPVAKIVGHYCHRYGREPGHHKDEAVRNWPPLSSLKEARAFMGLIVHFRKYIPGFALRARPIYIRMRKGVEFVPDQAMWDAQEDLKEAILSHPVLRPINFKLVATRKVHLQFDASPDGWGLMVAQHDERGELRPAAFLSKAWTEVQKRYSQYKREACGAIHAIQAAREYIYGVPFVLETDCLSLVHTIRDPRNCDSTVLRWVLTIRAMNPEVVHLPGRKNVVADALSRHNLENQRAGRSYDAEEFVDEVLGLIMRSARELAGVPSDEMRMERRLRLARLTEGTATYDVGRYMLGRKLFGWEVDSKLERRAQKYDFSRYYLARRKGDQLVRVLGREDDIRRVLEAVHDSPEGGHRGVKATIEKLSGRYWFERFEETVQNYVQSCEVCQKRSKRQEREPLTTINPPPGLFQRWHVDLATMVKPERYMVVFVEELSGWVEAFPLRTKEPERIMRLFVDNIVSRYGPAILIADGGEIDVDSARKEARRYGSAIQVVSAYHPQANGMVEREIQTIVNTLAKFCNANPSHWHRHLPAFLWSARTTVSQSRGRTPYEILFGQVPVHPIEMIIETWSGREDLATKSFEELLEWRTEQLIRKTEALEEVRARIRRVREAAKERYAQEHPQRARPLAVGDWVLRRESRLEMTWGEKLANWYAGPFQISKVLLGGTYALKDPAGTELKKPVHGNRLRLFHRRAEKVWDVGEVDKGG